MYHIYYICDTHPTRKIINFMSKKFNLPDPFRVLYNNIKRSVFHIYDMLRKSGPASLETGKMAEIE